MKRTRSICLLFIFIGIAIIICFWFGFLFGKETQRQKDLVAISEAKLEIETLTRQNDRMAKTIEFQEVQIAMSEDSIYPEEKSSVAANSEHAQPQFYLKEFDEYVCVYVSATDEMYFETDIHVSDLPVELQEDVRIGLDFYNLESVYTFLENYSS